MKRLIIIVAGLLAAVSCSPRLQPAAGTEQTASFMARPDGFRERYALEEMVVMSRHNIRSPLSGPGSVLSRITPHEWFPWTSSPGELSLRGGAL